MRYVIQLTNWKVHGEEEPLYWSNEDGWGSLTNATVFLGTTGYRKPIGPCEWIQLPEHDVAISNNPTDNWRDDLVQFARLIAEIEANGVISDNADLRGLLDSMDTSTKDLLELIDRAQKYWDRIKERT
jgi:hypothetical protein